MNNKIVCVSDVQLGYGSPQIPKLVKHLCDEYRYDGIILHPTDPRKPKLQNLNLGISSKEIVISDPYAANGRKEYLNKARVLVEELKPDILIICTTFCLPLLFGLEYRPKFVIYYYLETAMVYGEKDTELNSKIGSLVDLIIFTEENRAVRFGEVCGFQNIPFCIIYNCVNSSQINTIIPPEKRNGKIIYQGTIRDDACTDYFFDIRMQTIPIDLYGNIDHAQKDKYEKEFQRFQEDVRYLGYLGSQELEELRKHYLYSIVIWKPINENNLYASPNKFFESIASGLPPIAAPHPQCKMLINRYNCGLVMNGWDFDSFYQKIRLGIELYKTDEYEKMVTNCYKAIKEELNWETQMKKLKPHLKSV